MKLNTIPAQRKESVSIDDVSVLKIATNNSIGCFIAQVDKFHPSILWTLFSGNDYDKYQV